MRLDGSSACGQAESCGFRIGFEISDARRNNSQFEKDNRDYNLTEPIQLYGELYFEDILGANRPARFKAGRVAIEYLDRRLLSRNEWRNTTNTFEGAQAIFGQQSSDWQLDLLALRPLLRLQERLDQPDYAQKFYGAIFDFRRWSNVVTLQPYYLVLEQDGDKVRYTQDGNRAGNAAKIDRDIHTAGLRAYAIVPDTELDYDLDVVKQWGEQATQEHDAHAYNFELGYTLDNKYRPRFSAHYGLASGDVNSTDTKNQRFERLFGFSRPWSNNDYIQMENIRAIKLRTELDVTSNLKVDFGYSWYDLASSTDRWQAAGLRDTTGNSGKRIGREADLRIRFPVVDHLYAQVGYVYFRGGDFARQTARRIDPGRHIDSHFLYTELTVSAF